MVRILISGLVLFVAGTAQAAVTSVICSPNGAQIDVSQKTQITVGWIVSSSASGTVTSAEGVFKTADGKVLGSVSTPLNAALPAKGNTSFVESIVVPAAIAVKVHLMGDKQLFYERRFGDGKGEAAGRMILNIAAEAGTNLRIRHFSDQAATITYFDVSRMTLVFEPDAPLATVKVKSDLKAKAKIGFTSSGILVADWEVAGPDPGNNPNFRKLNDIDQLLNSDGAGGQLTLVSPALPTDAKGIYLVRFNVTTPHLPFDAPEIRYVVGDK
jgi:hypothetical protein